MKANIQTEYKPEHIKAAAFDMDGTLLRSDNTLSQRSIRAVKALEERGITPILATGRSFEALKPYSDALAVTAPLVCYNGAAVLDPRTGKAVFAHYLAEKSAREVISIARKFGIHIHAFHETELVYEKSREESDFYERHTGLKGRVVDFDTMDELRFFKAMFVGEHEKLEKLAHEVRMVCGDDVYGVFSLPYFFEMMSPKAGKRNGLEEAAGQVGASWNEVIAFGDGHNDLDMLKWAGIGVAMENAAEDVLRQVPLHAPSNDNDGAARFLEDFFDLPG